MIVHEYKRECFEEEIYNGKKEFSVNAKKKADWFSDETFLLTWRSDGFTKWA